MYIFTNMQIYYYECKFLQWNYLKLKPEFSNIKTKYNFVSLQLNQVKVILIKIAL